MKVLGKKGKNTILEVTPYELKTIMTALFEWQGVEDDTSEPVRDFDKVFNRIARAEGKFNSLPLKKQRALPKGKVNLIGEDT